jgi:5-(carboxyamino)imidazole ribonucleotide mutase
MPAPLVAIIMGSTSDWDGCMASASTTLDELAIPHEARALSAHRTTDACLEYVAGLADRGVRVLIAGAGGAAHLPGVCAAKTLLPVIGVPVESASLRGLDSLFSIVQMPPGIPVPTMAIGKPGAINAALCAAAILALTDRGIRDRLAAYRAAQAEKVIARSWIKRAD